MSKYAFNDIEIMHQKFKVAKTVHTMTPEVLSKFLQFRINCLEEELRETKDAFAKRDWDGVVDGIIDGLVFGIGTLDAFEVDVEKAWNSVFDANMNKEVGMKESRKNDFGFPDLVKPGGWVGPDHSDNVGLLAKIG